jgi:hypothetical protein
MGEASMEETNIESEATTLLKQVLDTMLESDYDHETHLERCLMKMQHAFQLLNWTEQIGAITFELRGYPKKVRQPEWRKLSYYQSYKKDPAYIGSWVPDEVLKGEGVKEWDMPDSVATILESRKRCITHKGYRHLETPEKSQGAHFIEVITIQTSDYDNLLSNIKQEYFGLCSRAIAQIQFGHTIVSVFEKYRQAVESRLVQLGIANNLEAAVHDVSRENPESWRNAVMGCRNILSDLADKLWQAPDDEYPYLGKMKLKGAPTDLVKNRLCAWLHQKGIRRSDDKIVELQMLNLVNMVNELYSLGSKAKRQIEYQDALCCLINTYTLLGEIALRTDMQPITQIKSMNKQV